MKSVNLLSLPLASTIFIIGALNSTHASVSMDNGKVEKTSIEQLVLDTLKHTENAISQIRINPESAKNSINQAVTSINSIENHYKHKTRIDLENDGTTVTATSYHHYYPKIDTALIQDLHSYPTLKYKLDTGILYKGNANQSASDKYFYLDYTFAKASLITAREAVNANHELETLANLRRTFEAIYVNPDFNVSSVDK